MIESRFVQLLKLRKLTRGPLFVVPFFRSSFALHRPRFSFVCFLRLYS